MKTKSTLFLWHAIVTALLQPSLDAAEMSHTKSSLIAELGSPSPEVRNAAAKSLRATYVLPAATNWYSLTNQLKAGAPKSEVLILLGDATNHVAGGGGSGNTYEQRFRLDDLWLLRCSFRMAGTNDVLVGVGLIEGLRSIPVSPPTNFSGVWINYYVNGQPSGQGNVKNGSADGVSTGFYPDGSKLMVHNWSRGVSDGEEVAYYPSGKVKYRGQYKDGTQVGVWVWYEEDGSVELQRNYDSKK
jgi:hypothetical protein